MKKINTTYLNGTMVTEAELRDALKNVLSQPVEYEEEHGMIVSINKDEHGVIETWLHLDPEKARDALKKHDAAGFGLSAETPRYLTLNRNGHMGWNYRGMHRIIRGVFKPW